MHSLTSRWSFHPLTGFNGVHYTCKRLWRSMNSNHLHVNDPRKFFFFFSSGHTLQRADSIFHWRQPQSRKTINNRLGSKWKRHFLGSNSEIYSVTSTLAQPQTERLPGTVQAITPTGVNRKSSEFQEFRSSSHLLPGISGSHPTLFILPSNFFFFLCLSNWLSWFRCLRWANEETVSTLSAVYTTASSLCLHTVATKASGLPSTGEHM